MIQRKKIIKLLSRVAFIGVIFWFAYTKGWIMTNFESINATQALQMLENDNNVTLLDIRTIEEYEEGHLPGATFIPVQVLEKKLDMLKQDKDKKIIVYCRSGNRSIRGSRILEKHGFIPLNVKGGINALKKANAEIIK